MTEKLSIMNTDRKR